tara:strand:+ start:95 stop:496 length:402 start_codon:yes stop_codon:yes gene_type:complete
MNYEEREERLIHKLSMKKIQDELNDDEEEDGPFTHNERLLRGLLLVHMNEYEIFENKQERKESNRSINTSLENCMIILKVMLRNTNDREWKEIIDDEIDIVQIEMNKRKKIAFSQLPNLSDDMLELVAKQLKD